MIDIDNFRDFIASTIQKIAMSRLRRIPWPRRQGIGVSGADRRAVVFLVVAVVVVDGGLGV